jgi:hypothetical protein
LLMRGQGGFASGASAAGVRGESWEDPTAPKPARENRPRNAPKKSSKKAPSHIEKGNVKQLRKDD